MISVNVGRAFDAEWAGKLKRTAIDKRPTAGRVTVRRLGLDGDEQADKANHGGPYQAVYAYSREDLDWWAAQMGYEQRHGMFGENLTVAGVDATDTLIGERWEIGSALVEVAGPRIPCQVFRAWMGKKGWVKRFALEARPGAYLSVLEEGEIGAGDQIRAVHRPDHGITLRGVFRTFYGDREVLDLLRTTPGLPPKVRALGER